MTQMTAERTEALILRSSAHAAAESVLRPAQRFQHGVTDLDVSRVMFALESGVRPYRNPRGRWLAPSGELTGLGRRLSTIVNEMIRTGLVRYYVDQDGDHLIPAKVHFPHRDNPRLSACLFVGEDMGPMRTRLLDHLDLVDCLACEQAICAVSGL